MTLTLENHKSDYLLGFLQRDLYTDGLHVAVKLYTRSSNNVMTAELHDTIDVSLDSICSTVPSIHMPDTDTFGIHSY